MLIKYIIPEDGDEMAHPNVFNLESSTATLNDIRKGFPVPGTFHFRFLKSLNNMNVWMDAVDGQTEITASNGSIFLKASRPASGFPPVSINIPAQEPVIDSSPSQLSKPPKPVKQTTDNLIFDYNEPTTQAKNAPAATFEPLLPEDDLLGMNSSSSGQKQQSNSSQSDLFGLESLQPTKPTPMSSMNNSRGVSPMGGMSMSTPMMQHQPANTSNRMGGVGGMSSGIGGMGSGGMGSGGMSSQQKSGGFDPFDNLTGLNSSRPMGQQPYNSQQQQSSFNNNRNNMNQNNRGRGY